MKIQSDVYPQPFLISPCGQDSCYVLFTDQVIPCEIDGQIFYQYESFVLTEPYRDTLEQEISNQYDLWLQKAKDFDRQHQAHQVRQRRNRLLDQSDWTQMPDVESHIAQSWKAYRQALRDIPQQQQFPYDVQWPSPPNTCAK